MRIPIARDLLIVLVLTFTAALSGYGQIVVTRPAIRPIASPTPTQKIPIFMENRGSPRQIEPRKLGTGVPPAPLSTTEKNTILQTALKDSMVQRKLAAIPFAVLSPRTPYIPDRAALEIYGAIFVHTSDRNEAGFEPGYVAVNVAVYPQKQGQWFMIDCSIETEPDEAQTFTMSTSGSGAKTEILVKGSGHIQALLATQTLKWYELWIRGEKTWWVLYGCEVNAAN